ncbi:hypothetical protein JCM10207_001313 [Rhodosporidiobolus poonsookiae]
MPPRRKPTKPTPASKAASTAPPPLPDGAPQPGTNRYLPPHEAELFRQVLTLYENKENSKGLETVNQILDKFPDHGESLTMRGIFQHSLGDKSTGYASIKRGVHNDLGSHIVWHVYALTLRADKRFEEALTCYKKACEIEKDSLNLLTDLSTLTIHLRRYPSYVSTRLNILRIQPRLRRNWLALAVAQFLASDHSAASQTLTQYEAMLRDVPEGDVEMGEVLLFHAQVLEEAGEYEKCVEFLGEKSGEIADRSAYATQRARLLLKLGRTESALWAWEVLLGENPDSREYIRAMVQAKGGDCDDKTPEGREKAVAILDELADKYPRSMGIKRLALDLASGDRFRALLTPYLLHGLTKGIPSLFADIKALYRLPGGEGAEKAKVVGEVVEEFKKGLEEQGRVGGEGDDVDTPSTYLWTLYFLASHHSHPLNPSSSQPLALSVLSLAESHTPSLPELQTLRARILKRAGDPAAAAHAMEAARRLDGQDRGLNCASAKYAIRAGEWERAEKTVGLFTKKDAPSPLEDLVEMQCLWFLQEEGDAFLQQEDYGRALKRYHQILDIFQEIEEDQYDFHSYCMRKSTLKAYIELLRFEDRLRDHPRFVAAARGAVSVYCKMHDEPGLFPEPPSEEGEGEKKVNGEVKEEVKEEQKEESKEEPAQAGGKKDKKGKGKKVAEPAPSTSTPPPPPPDPFANVYTDPNPSGSLLLTAGRASPLAQAKLFTAHLARVCPQSVETWVLVAEVATREGGEKLVQALKALRSAREFNAADARLLPVTVRFVRAVQALGAETNPAVASVLRAGAVELVGGAGAVEDAARWVDEQLQRSASAAAGDEAEWVVQAAEAKRVAGAQEEEVAALVRQVVEREDLKASLKHATRAFAFLRSLPSSADVHSFRAAAASRFPLARAFKTADELAALDAELAKAEAEEEKGEGKAEVVEEQA